ncbi:MAG: hypothetical protein ACOYXO_05355 [Chloroflexota bacterium]
MDWFTIIAQIINFLILMLLLRRFLYAPIVNAMEQRERMIKERIQHAERIQQEAERERQRYLSLNQELNEHFESKKKQAEEEAQLWRKEALQRARAEVEKTLEEWHKSVSREMDSFRLELRRFAVQQTFTLASRTLRDLADQSLEEHITAAFLSQLKNGKIDLSTLKHASNLVIQSAFELAPQWRMQLHQVLTGLLGNEISLEFQTRPELTAGIEVVTPQGYQVGWNLQRYLEALD